MKKIQQIMVSPKLLFSLVALIAMPILSFAQEFTDDVMDTPIDGGLSLLVAAGVGYGAKQLKKRKNSIPQK
jgi:hypothetical protein